MMESRTRRFLGYEPARGRQAAPVRIEEFQGKIAAARAADRECDLLVVARTEALIADLGLEEALRRAHAYSRSRYDPCSLQAKNTEGVSVGSRFFLHHSS
jgi:hypothetical protein